MNLIEKDAKYLWHPYTQHKTAASPVAIVRGEGAILWDEHDKEYIDAIASWWVNPFGHSNRVIADAIYKQLTTLEHVLFGGFTHAPAVQVAEKLLPMRTGRGFDKTAFQKIPQWIYMGALDDNDAVQFDDAYSAEERHIVNTQLGQNVQPRFVRCQQLYLENGVQCLFTTYENIGHWTTSEINLAVIRFFTQQLRVN